MKRLLEVEKEINYLVHGKCSFGAPRSSSRAAEQAVNNSPCTKELKDEIEILIGDYEKEKERVLDLINALPSSSDNITIKDKFFEEYTKQYDKLSEFTVKPTDKVKDCNQIISNINNYTMEISRINQKTIERIYNQKKKIAENEQKQKESDKEYNQAVEKGTISANRDIYELTKSFPDENPSIKDQLKRYICYLQVFVIDPIHDNFSKDDTDLIRDFYIKNIIQVINKLINEGLLQKPHVNKPTLLKYIETLFPDWELTQPDHEDLDKHGKPKEKPSHADGYVIQIFQDSLPRTSDKLELVMINILEILFGDTTVEALFPIATPCGVYNKSMYRILQGNQSQTPTFSEDNEQTLLIVTDVYPTKVEKTLALQTFFEQYNQNPRRYPFKMVHVDTIANDHDEGTFESWQLNSIDRLQIFDISAGHLYINEFFTFHGNRKIYKAPITEYSITRKKFGAETELKINHVFGDRGISGTFTEAKVEEIKKKIEGTDENKVAKVLSKFFCDKAIRDTAQELPNVQALKDDKEYNNSFLVMFLSNDGICSSAAAQTLPGAIFNLSRLVGELAQGTEHIAVRPGSTLQQWLNRHPERPSASAGATDSQGAVAGAQDSQQTQQQTGFETALTTSVLTDPFSKAPSSPSKAPGFLDYKEAPEVQSPGVRVNVQENEFLEWLSGLTENERLDILREHYPGTERALGGTPSRVRRRSKNSEESVLPPRQRPFPVGSQESTDSERGLEEPNLMDTQFGKHSLQKKIHELEKEIKYLGKSNGR